MQNKAQIFYELQQSVISRLAILKGRFRNFALLRIGVFVMFVVAAVYLLKLSMFTLLWPVTALFVVSFLWLIKKHEKIKKSMDLAKNLVDINREETQRISMDFGALFDGAMFVNMDHPYSADLDIFGKNSLFQMLNRAETHGGRVRLQSWLSQPAEAKEITQRQKAVSELTPMVKWRQHLQAHGRQRHERQDQQQVFFEWLMKRDQVRDRLWKRIIPLLAIAGSLALMVCYIAGLISFQWLLLPFVVNGFFLYLIHNYSKTTYQMTVDGVKLLGSIRNILLGIEQHTFKNAYLKNLKQELHRTDRAASEITKELGNIFEYLNLRGNQFYQIINGLFLTDYIFLGRAEKWRRKYKNEIAGWFEVVYNFEALSSLAAYAFANEDYAYPEITEAAYMFETKRMAHPLIARDKRVSNDFTLSGRGKTCIITGSNMAGKSTFLRTVGINAVLAFAGAPVCATAMKVSVSQIFSSMRTKDNLEENISSFYAELIRLKMLLENINSNRPTLFLLDEILKGTNSVDRHIGAESLIVQLSTSNSFGLVSTHDLALGKLQKIHDFITNYNFSSYIDGEEIIFDYKLGDGICQSTNASQLMAKIGIKIKSEL